MAVDSFDFTPKAPEFVSLSLEDALALSAERGLTPRVRADGAHGPWTADNRPNRLNLDVVHGVVVQACWF